MFSKITVLASTLLISLTVFAAETRQVKGMHCGGCVDMVKAKVCALPQIASCDAKLVEGKKNTGEITYELKEGQTLDEKTLASTIKEAGDSYSLLPNKPAKKKATKKN